MTRPSVRGCPVCGRAECEVLHTQRFVLPAGHPLEAGYDVVECANCGFAFADTAATQADYDRFYADHSKYTDDRTSTGGGVDPLDARRLTDTAAAVAEFFPDRSSRLVDVGCANGGLLVALRELGYRNLCGVDPSPACVANARRAGIDAQVGKVDAIPASAGPADGVLMTHVLEHVRELRPALAAVHAILKPAGRVYVEVPDAARYADYVHAPFQDFNTEHINHFSHTTLENLAAACGFAPAARGEKLLEVAPETPYPALYQVWSVADGPRLASFRRDPALRRSMDDYIAKSRRLLAAIDDALGRALPSGPVVVWGVGQLAMKLLAETALGRAEVVAFVDGNPINHGKTLRGVPVLPPDAARRFPHPIVVGSILHERAIARQAAQELGLPNRLILLGGLLPPGVRG